MPLLIIAGIPNPVFRRKRNYAPVVDEWEVRLVSSRDNRRAELYSCWSDVISIADNSEDGAHILAYHFREDDYPKFNENLYDRHRLIWMSKGTLGDYGSYAYTELIRSRVEFETKWRANIRPKGVEAPSLLPESSFSPINCKDMWRRIRSVHSEHDDVEGIVKLIAHFRETHYQNGCWEDARGIQFRAAPERHGLFPPYGITKFTYRLPDGFHYNVRGASYRRRFEIKDVEGKVFRFHTYTNIDCHGSVRGGK